MNPQIIPDGFFKMSLAKQLIIGGIGISFFNPIGLLIATLGTLLYFRFLF